ncbi:MAG TPA: serine/threonine protein kinase [Anaerolineae bacterium]|nr:serine/threonine protein kinase [Anaerolineae bacterium]
MVEENVVLNGRYELLARIGSGGMAQVYKSQDRALGRIVAIKVLHESLTSDPGFLERFQREAHAAANLSHPNIVTVHDIGQDGNRYYIVMEYVEGQTLKQIVREYGDKGVTMPINQALDLIIQTSAGLGYAHRANLVHCDIKPHNILVARDSRVKVADFGIARAMSQATQQGTISQIWGTPQYFSPEQAAGLTPTPASDVYALGVMLFEMLTGRLPFAAESHTAMALKHLHTPPPLASTYNPAVPAQLDHIVDKLLAKEPSSRYRTAGQVSRILTAYRDRSLQDTGPIATIATATTQLPEATQSGVPVYEQQTQVYQRPSANDDAPTPTTPARPLPASQTLTYKASDDAPESTDWVTIGLGIAALIALLGLIPLWIAVYLAWSQ